MLAKLAGPRKLDSHQADKVQPQTLVLFRKHALIFSSWLLEHGHTPQGIEAWDDLLVEFKNDPGAFNGKPITKSQFTYVVAAVEFFSSISRRAPLVS